MTDGVREAAQAVHANAHAPYSRFLVGAALEAEDGRVFVGVNVENASLGLTICAERVALGAAIAAGARRFRRIVVVSQSTPPAAPCGACRQALAEFGVDLIVDAVNGPDARRWRLGDLLPDHFGPADLGV